jgi:ApeA N-terminal domain 1
MSAEERSHFLDFEVAGKWWLPETPDRRIYGTLRYSRVGGINIDLMDPIKEVDWNPGPVPVDSPPNEFKIVLGQSDRFESCTALGAIETFVLTRPSF